MDILVACEFSGVVRDAFRARGHDAVSCDLEPTERPGPHYQCDVREIVEVKRITASEHVYAYTGSIPCTGPRRCIHCGAREK